MLERRILLVTRICLILFVWIDNCTGFYETFYEEPTIPEDKRSGVRWDMFKWPEHIIPYELDSNLSSEEQTFVHQALKVLNQKTCIKFERRNKAKHGNRRYILYQKDEQQCGTSVGYDPNPLRSYHPIKLSPHCLTLPAAVQHESMHALGLFHEQCRYDRDKYIEIIWDNIDPRYQHNFIKIPSVLAIGYDVDYDFESVMHYPENAFAIQGKNETMRLRKGVQNAFGHMGQIKGPSKGDVMKLNAMYECPEFHLN